MAWSAAGSSLSFRRARLSPSIVPLGMTPHTTSQKILKAPISPGAFAFDVHQVHGTPVSRIPDHRNIAIPASLVITLKYLKSNIGFLFPGKLTAPEFAPYRIDPRALHLIPSISRRASSSRHASSLI